MKVISILQPWATLIVSGHKKIETRSWNTSYRGPLLIHASANKRGISWTNLNQSPFNKCLPLHKDKIGITEVDFDSLSFGAIIGQVNLMDAIPTKQLQITKNIGMLNPIKE
jgi:hypothetical protein